MAVRIAPRLMLGVMLGMLLLVSEGISSSSHTVPDCVRLSYDKFKDRTTVQLKNQYAYKDAGFMAATFAGQLSFYFHCTGDTLYAPDSLTFEIVHGALVIQHRGKANDIAWSFRREDDHELILIVGEQRLPLGHMRYARGEEAMGFLESRGLQVPRGLLERTTPEVLTLTLPTATGLSAMEATSTEGQVDDFRFFLQNTRGHAANHYREFAEFVRTLPQVSLESNTTQ